MIACIHWYGVRMGFLFQHILGKSLGKKCNALELSIYLWNELLWSRAPEEYALIMLIHPEM